MRPDGTWVCPVCNGETNETACWHETFSGAVGTNGCSTWYGGRLLHLSLEEVTMLKSARGVRWGTGSRKVIQQLGLMEFMVHSELEGREEVRVDLTGEGENLCRHLWGFEKEDERG